ncbi:MAG: DUF6427 family protein [Bacteroidia bacterium]
MLLFTLILGVFAVNFSFNASVFGDSALYYFFQSTQIGFLPKTAGVLLLLINVFLFDLFLNSEEITEKNNHVPAFLLGIFLCYAISQNPLHPILFAQLLISISIWRFISVYKSDKAFSAIFDGAFALSFATILYPPYSVFILLCFVCLLTLRSFSLREWILTLIGIAIPYLFYFSLLFLLDKNPSQIVLNLVNSFHKPSIPSYLKGSFLINFIVSIISVFSLLFFGLKTVSNKIKTQKAFVIYLWMFILSVPTWFIISTGAAFSGLLSIMPLSIFCGIYLGNTKSRILAELLLWSLLILFVISMLQQASVIK